MLIAPFNEQNNKDELLNKVLNINQNDLSLKDSYVLEKGEIYEEYILRKLKQNCSNFGFRIKKTPRTRDGGADIVIETVIGDTIGLVQCKWVSDPKKNPEDIVKDLERAAKNYEVANSRVFKIGITNASKIKKEDKIWEESNAKHIIFFDQNGLDPEKIFGLLPSL